MVRGRVGMGNAGLYEEEVISWLVFHRESAMGGKMNWDRVNRENREIRNRESSPAKVQIDTDKVCRITGTEFAKTKAATAANRSKAQPRARKVVVAQVSPLLAALRHVSQARQEHVANWSQADLKGARELCHAAALFFNEQLKDRPKRLLVPPKIKKRR
jgi:hypothetical protein